MWANRQRKRRHREERQAEKKQRHQSRKGHIVVRGFDGHQSDRGPGTLLKELDTDQREDMSKFNKLDFCADIKPLIDSKSAR